VRDEIGRDLDALDGRPEDEVARMEDVVVARRDGRLRRVLLGLGLVVRMDRRDVGVLELEKLVAEPEIDAGGLDLNLRIVQRLDDEIAVESPLDVGVREYHTRVRERSGQKWGGRV